MKTKKHYLTEAVINGNNSFDIQKDKKITEDALKAMDLYAKAINFNSNGKTKEIKYNKITQKAIESLGFKFICKNEENDSDYSLNKPSSKKGWCYLIVWHPKDNHIIISHHLMSKNITINDIRTLFNGKTDDFDYLKTIVDCVTK